MSEAVVYRVPDRWDASQISGGYGRQVLVVLPVSEHNSEEESFLSKIFAAVQMDFEKDAACLLVPPKTPFSLVPFASSQQAEKVLVFGRLPKQLGMSLRVQFYQNFSWGKTEYLFNESIQILENDRERKGHLWAALKAMFL